MKRMLAWVLASLAALTVIPISAFAADPSVAERAAEIEKKYGIAIEYPTGSDGNPVIGNNNLDTLDMALENVTPAAVKEISQYYRDKNGKRLTISYVTADTYDYAGSDNFARGNIALFGEFDDKTSLIRLHIPRSNSSTLASGDAPIAIVHELGHALHVMYTDRYGEAQMEREWLALNESARYDEDNVMQNPNDKLFVSGRAATEYVEDVAETIAHVFVRNQAGQGFKNRLSSGEKQTGLGKKVAYIEQMLSGCLKENASALENYRKIYSTPTSVAYQSLKLSGDYLQYAGYPQPKYVLNGNLRELGVEKSKAAWILPIGGWYVEGTKGERIIVFPGGDWLDVPADFQSPLS